MESLRKLASTLLAREKHTTYDYHPCVSPLDPGLCPIIPRSGGVSIAVVISAEKQLPVIQIVFASAAVVMLLSSARNPHFFVVP